MSDFKPLADSFSVSQQISCDDVREAARLGFTMIINNRPDGESEDQPSSADIKAASHAEGLKYFDIPVTHAGFNEQQIEALLEALLEGSEKTLAFCRSGTRSTLLWALAQASMGCSLAEISKSAENAGYDVSSIRPALDVLAARAAST